MTGALVQIHLDDEPTADSRAIAKAMGNAHKSALKLVDRYLAKFSEFGKVRFEISPYAGSRTGQKERYALLNENQSYLLLSLSRNTKRVVELKTRLVHEFAKARVAVKLVGQPIGALWLDWERRERVSKEKAGEGGRLLCTRRHEKAALRAEQQELEGRIQQKLFASDPA